MSSQHDSPVFPGAIINLVDHLEELVSFPSMPRREDAMRAFLSLPRLLLARLLRSGGIKASEEPSLRVFLASVHPRVSDQESTHRSTPTYIID